MLKYNRPVYCFALIALGLLGPLVAQDSLVRPANTTTIREAIVTADFERVQEKTVQMIDKHGAEQTLLVLDIDNTLLAMNQSFGSDQWFDWQSELLKKEPCSEVLVANNFEGLVEVQKLIFEISRMHPPQPDLPTIVSDLHPKVKTIVLTSRGLTLRDVAERELSRNGYSFQKVFI